ncbi:hypothetical protein [Falsibacillus albus]|uniref:Oxalate:formate antiporter n=1 Tax=Falsibacillus albus TaxID=2478915 RepID=A0A3L7JQT7_9BACI|nr:hypothetical protein [Falsibacillus albus]RLQ93188.1 hypothetical protein D9X91_18315 [Falsibacillus albus]
MKHSQELSNLVYIHVHQSEQYVLSYGIEFKEFMAGVSEPPSKLLLLKHQFEDTEYNVHTLMEFVEHDQINKLIKDDVYGYGDFCWVDFEEEEALNQLDGQELAELLYLSHVKHHLRHPFYRKLNNRFVYLAHDDGWFNKMYFRSFDEFYDMLGYSISQKLTLQKAEKTFFGLKKKKEYPVMPKEILYPFIEDMKEGIVFSVEKAEQSRAKIEIPVWVIGDFSDMDEMHEEYQTIQSQPIDGKIVFDRKSREWKAFIK